MSEKLVAPIRLDRRKSASDLGIGVEDLLDDVLTAEYRDLDLCVDERSPECSRFRGGCKEYRTRSKN